MPASQTTYVYKTIDEPNSQPKFFGHETDNPVQFLRSCERSMETVNDSLSEVDKINWVVRQLKGTMAEWFTIVQVKITVYKELVDHFRARYWNEEVQRKIRVQLEFGKYTPTKGSKEKYLIQLVSNAKYLDCLLYTSRCV